jgi:hypothetical protein
MILLTRGLAIEESIHAAKQNSILKKRPSAIFDLSGLMVRD